MQEAMKDYKIMKVSEDKIGLGKTHWETVLEPTPGTQIEDVDVFSDHIIRYLLNTLYNVVHVLPR